MSLDTEPDHRAHTLYFCLASAPWAVLRSEHTGPGVQGMFTALNCDLCALTTQEQEVMPEEAPQGQPWCHLPSAEIQSLTQLKAPGLIEKTH